MKPGILLAAYDVSHPFGDFRGVWRKRPDDDVDHPAAAEGTDIKPLAGEKRDAFAVIAVFGFGGRLWT